MMNNKRLSVRTKPRLRLLSVRAAVSLLALSTLFTQLFALPAFAAGSMYLAATPGTVQYGSNVTVSLRINPSTAVTVVEGTVGFNAAQLQYVGLDASGSAFDTSVQQKNTGSSVSVTRAKLDPSGVNSDSLIVNIIFKALASSGSSPLTLTDANAVYNGGYTNPSLSGTSVTFTAGSCPSGQVGTPQNCTTTPANTGTKTAPNTVAAPKPSDAASKDKEAAVTTVADPGSPQISERKIQFTMFTIMATTQSASSVYLAYGTSKDALITQTPLTPSDTKHTITVDKGLTPGTTIYYKVVATDGQATTSSAVQSLKLRGFTMKVTLMDKNMNIIPNQDITIIPSNQTATSNERGVATYTNLAPGDYVVQLTKGDTQHRQHISVLSVVEADLKAVQTAGEQQGVVIFDDYAQIPIMLQWLLPILILLLIIVVGVLIAKPWRKNSATARFVTRLKDKLLSKKSSQASTAQPQVVTVSTTTPTAASDTTWPTPAEHSRPVATDSQEPKPYNQPGVKL